MKVTVTPGYLRGTVSAPPSKSHAQRLLLAAALNDAPCRVLCEGNCADIRAMAGALNALGAEIGEDEAGYSVRGGIVPRGASARVDCGESGVVLRFLLPLCCCLEREVTLCGSAGLAKRPIKPLLRALRENGAAIAGDALPLRTAGGLKSGTFSLPGDVSSQFFSGLLFALPLLPGDSRLRFTTPPESAPYLDMTAAVLRRFGIAVRALPDGFLIPGGQRYHAPQTVRVEGDHSGAAFWLAANALGSDIQITGLDPDSCQGDRRIGEFLQRLGGEIDLRDHPDLMPVLAVCAMARPGKTRLTHLNRLRFKETDRLETVTRMILALGGRAELEDDSLTVYGTGISGGIVDGCGDHRIVMSAAVAGLCAKDPVTVTGAEAAGKSYLRFFADMERLGGNLSYE